ncbi:MAG: HAMP domain-containing protein [Desulfobacterales bacterium]|nr:HAMP domain-containing protein [Desulfobacterales bacterium]
MAQELKKTKKEKKYLGFFGLGQSIRGKLILWLMLISLVPLSIIGVINYIMASELFHKRLLNNMTSTVLFQEMDLQNYFIERSKNIDKITEDVYQLRFNAFNKMDTIKHLKKTLIENFFKESMASTKTFVSSPQLIEMIMAFRISTAKSRRQFDSVLSKFIKIRGFDSMMLIDPSGKVLYVSDGFVKPGISLKKYPGTPEYKAYKKATKGTGFLDFKLSYLRNNEPTAYFYNPVKDRGTLAGIALFRMANTSLDPILKESMGLGKDGESYLVGHDKMFRSNSKKFDEITIANPAFPVDNELVVKALEGIQGNQANINYLGELVLTSYAPINIAGNKYALMIEMDQAEVASPKIPESEKSYLAHAAATYGFPDLYLIGADGYVFYSVQQLSDFQTNLFSGPYKNSGLANVVSKVLKTQQMVVSDYSSYEPAGNKPTAFMAKPVIHNGIEFIVAFQIASTHLDEILGLKKIKGDKIKSAQSFLIGQDKLWRTESEFAEKYNVKSTRLNPKAAMDTPIVAQALQGKHGAKKTVNNISEDVLTAWTPFKFKDINWALIREVNLKQINQPIANLFRTTVLGLGIALIAILVISLLVSKGITEPIDQIMRVFKRVDQGDYEARVQITSKDEIGVMASSFNNMIAATQSLMQTSQKDHDHLQDSIMTLLDEISELADGDLSMRTTVREDATGTLADSLNMMLEELSEAFGKIKLSSEQVFSTANDLSSSTGDLAQHSINQSGLINNAVDEMNSLTTAIEDAAQKAEKSADTSKLSSQVAEDGAKVVENTSRAMETIRENVQDTARAIKRLGESSQEISDFTKTINDISDRTSILALNASIQAASAGEEGRGFAVVAEEIQRLAEQAAGSTRQIETLIKNILLEITAAGISMDASIQEVVNGTSLSQQALSRLKEITGSSNDVAKLISGLAATSKKQADTTAQLAKQMSEIGIISSDTAEETKKASESMKNMASTATEMLQSVAEFKLVPDETDVAWTTDIDEQETEIDEFDLIDQIEILDESDLIN